MSGDLCMEDRLPVGMEWLEGASGESNPANRNSESEFEEEDDEEWYWEEYDHTSSACASGGARKGRAGPGAAGQRCVVCFAVRVCVCVCDMFVGVCGVGIRVMMCVLGARVAPQEEGQEHGAVDQGGGRRDTHRHARDERVTYLRMLTPTPSHTCARTRAVWI